MSAKKTVEFKIHCTYTSLERPETLKPNPKNPNKHPEQQLRLLEKILIYQGFRAPIVVSKLSGLVVKGHARLEVSLRLKIPFVPVEFQEYPDAKAEAADLIADNELARLSRSEIDEIRAIALELGDGFDFDYLGIPDFYIPPGLTAFSAEDAAAAWDDMPEFTQEDKGAYRRIVVNFASDEDVVKFGKLIGQNLTKKTRSIWYPAAEWGLAAHLRYGEKK